MERLTDTQVDGLVQRLVHDHFDLEEGIERIIWVKNGDAQQDIRLIEVNRDTIPAGDFYAFYFAPSEDFPLPIRIGDATPDEWEKIQRGEIGLPSGWSLKQFKIFERSNA